MSGESILIVEDEGISALEIRECLESWGYQVPSVVDTGEKAIQEAFRLKPDLILMDIFLKGDMDGVDAAAIIKSFLDVPLIYLTALDDVELLKRVKDTKAAAYLIKPIEEVELHNNVELALENYRAHQKDILTGKRSGLEEVQSYMRSVLPELAANVPISERSVFLSRFARFFEQNMKPLFHKFAQKNSNDQYVNLNEEEKLKIYLSWISELYENLGFKVQTRVRGNKGVINVKKCSWSPSKPNDVFLCLMCQSIMQITYSWTDLPGKSRSSSTTGILNTVCKFDYGP
jgi:CheY-like chemotaxis protein